MKLTRFELVHATDKQLGAIGITRAHHPGWLKSAMMLDFTAEAVHAFCQARTKPVVEPKKLPVGARSIRPTVEEQLAEALEALAPFALFGKRFEGHDDILTPVVVHGVQALTKGAFQHAFQLLSRAAKRDKLRQKYRDPSAAEADSFANSVYEQSGRIWRDRHFPHENQNHPDTIHS